MTPAEIQELIQINLGVAGPQGQDLARAAYNAAKSRVARLDIVPWNKEATTFDTVSVTSSYIVGEDILTDYKGIKGIVSLFRTDVEGVEIPIYHHSVYNRYARGSTTPGAPTIATLNGRNKKLELYYYPDGVYTLWTYLRFALNTVDIPDDYIDILVWDGIKAITNEAKQPMVYGKAKEMYEFIYAQLENETLTKVEISQIRPAFILGNVTQRGQRAADSGNKFGMG